MSMKVLSGRLVRWFLQLQGYDFQIEYRIGTENVVADILSRYVEDLQLAVSQLLGFETVVFDSDG